MGTQWGRLLSKQRAAMGLGACALACRASPRAEQATTSAAAAAATPSMIEARARTLTPPDSSANGQRVRTPAPVRSAIASSKPDDAALVLQSAIPGCAPGLTQLSRRTSDGRENIACARVRGTKTTLHGPSWTWFDWDHLSGIDNYAEGSKQGRSVRWYRSGVRRREGEFLHGARQGLWRAFHLNGTLAEETGYDHGELHGLRRRFFESGRMSLETRYDHGAASGTWNAFYDREPPNLALTVALERGREQQAVRGFLPDGTPWKAAPSHGSCQQNGGCASALALLDLDALPPVLPEPCPLGGAQGHERNVAESQFASILKAARNAWPKSDPALTSSLAPMGCVDGIRISCATDLDGEPGSEVLAEIAYRVYQPDCVSAHRNSVTPTRAIVALSPPNARSAWSARGLLGYRAFDAPGIEAPPSLEVVGIVLLPSGEAAVRARESTDAGDCSGGRIDQVLLFGNGTWSVVTARTITACNERAEPDDADPF